MPEYIYQNPMFDDPARFAALSPIYQPQAPTYTPGAFDPNARVSEALLASGLSQGGGGLLGGGGAGTALGLLGGAAAVNSLTGGKLVDAAKSALGLGAGGALPAGASYLTPAAEQAAIASGWASGAGGGANALAGGAGGDSLLAAGGLAPALGVGIPLAVAAYMMANKKPKISYEEGIRRDAPIYQDMLNKYIAGDPSAIDKIENGGAAWGIQQAWNFGFIPEPPADVQKKIGDIANKNAEDERKRVAQSNLPSVSGIGSGGQ